MMEMDTKRNQRAFPGGVSLECQFKAGINCDLAEPNLILLFWNPMEMGKGILNIDLTEQIISN